MRDETMGRRTHKSQQKRQGIITVFVALLIVPLLGMLAFGVDYVYLLHVKTDLQRVADAASLAGARELVPRPDGTQDLDAVRTKVRQYAQTNLGDSFQVRDEDVEIGRYDPDTIYSLAGLSLLSSGRYDTVRVTVRRDDTANSPVSLFFGRVLGLGQSNVTATATAVLQRAKGLPAGSEVLPFSFHIDTWNMMDPGENFSIYGDQQVYDQYGNEVPGNWGTVDIGDENNSTSAIADQIENGLRQSDVDALYSDGRSPYTDHVEAPIQVDADPGLSSGLKSAVQAAHGKRKIIPLRDDSSNYSGGDTAEFNLVGWGVVEVVTSNWQGSQNSSVTVTRGYMYDGLLIPSDLDDTSNLIDGGFTRPVLVE